MKSEITRFLLIAAEKLTLFQNAAIKCQLPHPSDFKLSRVILRLLVKQTTFPQVSSCLCLLVLYCSGLQKKTSKGDRIHWIGMQEILQKNFFCQFQISFSKIKKDIFLALLAIQREQSMSAQHLLRMIISFFINRRKEEQNQQWLAFFLFCFYFGFF